MGSHADYVEAIKDTATKVAKSTLIDFVVSKLPVFASGPLGFLLGIVAGKIASILMEKTEFALFFKYIDMRSNYQGAQFSIHALDYRRVLLDPNSTEQEKKDAEIQLITAFRKFAKFTN